MADELAENAAKLQLDEETGEMVSKGELKRRIKKRATRASVAKQKEAKAKEVAAGGGDSASKPTPKPKEKTEDVVIDTDYMFKTGFLQDVFEIRPMKPVITRFPPEPNGFLHIGHAKAIAVNFGFARYHGGETILRFDDTNPEAEEEQYLDSIKNAVDWLGFKPVKITYSSDNFQKLYDHAEKLIELGKAYMCSCDEPEIKLQRGSEGTTPRYRCEHAEKSPEQNMEEFRKMRDGFYKPMEVFLRMKQDIESGNPQMWDLAAYRVKTAHHHRTGDTWKIYPTYDFTHCLCDSYESITHSLCTTEFINSRESYEWLNTTLGVYEPMQREYGRLALQQTVLSKRKILKLVTDKIVRGWDDPRLYTLPAVRRRGVPPGAILEFINDVGCTTSPSVISIKRFEQAVRKYLERTVPRLMMVLDPLPVVIQDGDEFDGKAMTVPFSPKDPKMGSHEVKFSKTVYIDYSDFREVDDPSFFRLAPGKTVGLLQTPFPIKAVSFTKDDTTGRIKEVQAVFDREGKRPKTYIQWVPTEAAGSRKAEVRIYQQLFKSDNPGALGANWMDDINRNAEVIYPNAMIESGFEEVKKRAPWPEAAGEGELGKGGPESVRFQGMRIAYFAMDTDSTDEKIVLNQIVPLKEDAEKSKGAEKGKVTGKK